MLADMLRLVDLDKQFGLATATVGIQPYLCFIGLIAILQFEL